MNTGIFALHTGSKWFVKAGLVLLLLSGCAVNPLPSPAGATLTPAPILPTAAPVSPMPTQTLPAPATLEPTRAPTPSTRCLPSGAGRAQPDDTWQFSSPAEQGLDATLLSQGLASLDAPSSIYSFLVIRHNQMVVEKYYNGSSAATANQTASITKSFISALTGIAIREGYLKGPQQKIAEILPDYFTGQSNPSKQNMTLQNFLSMASGLSPSALRGTDLVKDELDMPLVTPPGTYFWYDSALPHILSVIISKTSAMNTCEFAYRYLFEPLGVSLQSWDRDGQGYYVGAAGMYATPRTLARFGLLYLNQGRWNGQQILPPEWVAETFKPRVHVERKSDIDPEAGWWLAPQVTGYDAEFDYGYYWWLNTIRGHPIYSAIGWGGQKIHLIPDLDLVVVTTANSRLTPIDSLGWIEKYLIPSSR